MFKKFNFGEMVLPKIHEEGFTSIIVSGVISFIFLFFSKYLFFISLILTLLCIYFFRDPVRVVPRNDDFIVSPADGLILDIKDSCTPPLENDDSEVESYTRISIFLNVTNVHVNRIPISGIVKNMSYHRGKFINASFDKASDDNERQVVEIVSGGQSFFVVQIAGFVARRIVCDLKKDDEVKVGDRFGIIKFGSRVDLYIPTIYKDKILVRVGQTLIGGETLICDLNGESQEERCEFVKI